jgi:RNA polymerase sigma factor (sigma-70 family)
MVGSAGLRKASAPLHPSYKTAGREPHPKKPEHPCPPAGTNRQKRRRHRMGTPTVGTFLRRLRQAMAAEALIDTPDRDLIERFRADRDEAAFRALVERHGPMVFQVCRRSLACHADVEDAFQATFLVLVRRGHAIRRQASVASWLHGVAHRTALKLRTEAARRRRREDRAAAGRSTAMTDETPWGELRGVLDDELARLPAGCRSALVLCYLEGRTQDEAAAQLGLSKSTLRRRLDRGRELLGRRLARRGIALGAALAARLVSDCAGAAAPSRALVMRTAAAARHRAHPAGHAAPAGVVSPRVAALSDGVTKSMLYAKYQSVAAVLACGLALGIGVREFGPPPAAAQDPSPAAATKAANPDIEPIDPNLVFDPEIQKQLKLSANQVRQLADARDKAAAGAGEQTKKVAAIDQRMKELQAEIERLQRDRDTAQQAVDKAQAGGVKAAIPKVLSRDAVGQLRQITLQRMRLSDVLLDARVRARLNLNDEQVKKIQEINDKGTMPVTFGLNQTTPADGAFRFLNSIEYVTPLRVATLDTTKFSTQFLYTELSTSLTDESRAELIKVLTPQQREALEKLSGMTLEKKK